MDSSTPINAWQTVKSYGWLCLRVSGNALVCILEFINFIKPYNYWGGGVLCKIKSPLMLDLRRLAKPLSDLVNSILELTHNSWRIPELVCRMLACSTGVIFLCFSGEWGQSQSKRGVRLSSLAWKPSLTRKSHLNDSWILAKFFLHIYSPRWSQGQLKHKKERGHYSHLDQTNLVKKGIIAMPKRELFLAGPTWEIPSRQGGSIYSFTRICSFIHLSLFCCLIKLYTTFMKVYRYCIVL